MAPNYDSEVYDIEIEFAGHTGTFVEAMNWHTSQQTEVLPNGNLLLKLHCGINRELLGFIMYFLHNARVRKPKRLKDMVIKELEQVMEAYKGEKLLYRSALTVAVA
jgi:predicted DNA-binding transcriptional regulator YafY